MCITNKQKEGERWILSQPNSRTKSCSHGLYKYNSIYLFVHKKAPSFLLSIIIFVPCALLCLLFYGWFTLFYFFKFSISKGVDDEGRQKDHVEVSRNLDVAIEEVKKDCDCLTGDYVPSNDEEIEEKEIMEIETMATAEEEARTEEEADLVGDGRTEDVLIKPEVDQGCKETSLVRPPPWLSLCGMLEVLFHQKGYDCHDQ